MVVSEDEAARPVSLGQDGLRPFRTISLLLCGAFSWTWGISEPVPAGVRG